MPQTFNVGSRSIFVTVTAWIFIVASALAFVCALVENAAVASLLPAATIVGNVNPAPASLTGILLAYMPWVAGAALLMSLATLATAIGLLMRFEIARRVFIGLVCFVIALNLAGSWLQQEYMLSLVDATLSHVVLPAAAVGVFGGFVTAARVMAVLMSLGACAVMVWVLRRLTSAAVRQEFA
jgi:hypothetical protein